MLTRKPSWTIYLVVPMSQVNYIVRVGNEGFASRSSSMALNHWHYLIPQRLWGLPKDLPHVKVRAEFIANIENPLVTTYIWFLCNGYGGPGHFVQVGIGIPHSGNGPVANGDLPIPIEVMARLQQGFDHWFNWRPVSTDADFQNQLRRIPAPTPTFIPTLRRVTPGHASLPLFQDLLNGHEQRQARVITIASSREAPALEADFQNLLREQTEPSSEGFVYLIHMTGTTFYKIGMSLDPQLRLRTLQTGNPYTLTIRSTLAVPEMRSAETGLHRQFEAQRVSNGNAREWFDFSGGIGEVETAFGVPDRPERPRNLNSEEITCTGTGSKSIASTGVIQHN